MSVRELTQVPPVSSDVGLGKRPSFPLATCSRQETFLCLCPSLAAALRRMGPAPCLSSTIELTLDVGVVGKPARGGELGRDGPATTYLSLLQRHGQWRDSLPHSSLPMARRPVSVNVRAGELALSFTACNTPESISEPCLGCTSCGQHSIAGPGCKGCQ